MKQSFRNAVKKHLKSSTLMFAFAAAGLAYGSTQAYQYYSPSPHKTAYTECVEGKKACTSEEMALVKQHFDLSTRATTWLVLPQMWLLMGLGYRRDEKHKKRLEEEEDQKLDYLRKYLREEERASDLQQELEKTKEQLAPYLADEKRKADAAADAAAKQQLNQMAQDATTLQGQIKVGKKISIKQTPPQS